MSLWTDPPPLNWSTVYDSERRIKDGNETTQRGYYPVFLFSVPFVDTYEDFDPEVYLAMHQGTTSVREEFGRNAHYELQRRADLIRSRVPEYEERFSDLGLRLYGTSQIVTDYLYGSAFAKKYDFGDLDSGVDVSSDLEEMLDLYRILARRGGVNILDDEGIEDGARGSIVERRQYRFHRSIDRDPKVSALVKQVHGTTCQACGFNFEDYYGEQGEGYIEAHHLIPLSELPENEDVPMDPDEDFVVLCANFHRMVHRTIPALSIEELQELLDIQE